MAFCGLLPEAKTDVKCITRRRAGYRQKHPYTLRPGVLSRLAQSYRFSGEQPVDRQTIVFHDFCHLLRGYLGAGDLFSIHLTSRNDKPHKAAP